MKRRSLSRKQIVRLAEHHAARAARHARPGRSVPWDAPTHATPIADMRRARQALDAIAGYRLMFWSEGIQSEDNDTAAAWPDDTRPSGHFEKGPIRHV